MSLPFTDSNIVLFSLSAAVGVYFVSDFLTASGSRFPLLAAVLVFSNMVSKTATIQGIIQRALQREKAKKLGGRLKSVPGLVNNDLFSALSEVAQTELLEALVSLRDYGVNSKKVNDRRRRLFKMMSWRQQKLCEEAGYLGKVSKIDTLTDKNQRMFDGILSTTDAAYGLTPSHYELLKSQGTLQNTLSSNYRVIESLRHFVRDWTTETPDGTEADLEIAPMLHYIKSQLDAVIPPEKAAKTCVVVPGSGLGRVAHEIALHRNYGAVHAVEFSGLMHACNRFIYEKTPEKLHTFFPWIHTTSNFITTDAQFRESSIPAGTAQPANLHLHLDDFRYFEVPNKEQYENVVVVSAFFIDTAQNIIDYFDQINQLTAPSKKASVKNGYWINYGPLKYGTASQAELNASEIDFVRRKMGWVDSHRLNSIERPQDEFAQGGPAGSGLAGYITDKESFWQGYYGVAMWNSAQKENKDKR